MNTVRLESAEKVFSMAGAILVPVAIALLGYCASDAELERQKDDRLMPFVSSLSSENEKERKTASKLFTYYNKKAMLPDDSAALFVIVATDENAEIAKEGQEAIVEASKNNKNLGEKIGDAIVNSDQRTKEKIIEATTINEDLKITLVGNTEPNKTNKSDGTIKSGSAIVNEIQTATKTDEDKDQMKSNSNKDGSSKPTYNKSPLPTSDN